MTPTSPDAGRIAAGKRRSWIFAHLCSGSAGVMLPTFYFALFGQVNPGTLIMPIAVVIMWLIYIAAHLKDESQ